MQPERQISIALLGVGAALDIPQYVGVAHHLAPAPGMSLAVGTLLGALAVLLGALLAVDFSGIARVVVFGFWVAVALAFSGVTAFCAAHGLAGGRRVFFDLVAVLPLVGPILVLARSSAS
jgi:hypothetical protein